MKFDSLSNFFDSLIDGNVDMEALNEAAAKEEFIPDPEELEIELQQEAEMLKLAHGGFSDMIDFEQAVRDGSAKNFHQQNGFPGMMGAAPPNVEEAKEEAKAKIMKDSKDKDTKMPVTEDAAQVVMEKPTDAASTSESAATQTPVSEPEPEPESEAAVDEGSGGESENVPEPEPVVDSVVAEEATATHTKDEL